MRKPTPRKRLDEPRLAELATQGRDVNVNHLGRAVPVRAPHSVEKLLARDHLSGIAREKLQDPVLLGRARNELTRRANRPHATIDLDAIEMLHGSRLRLSRVRAAQHRVDPGDELSHAKWLDDIVVGAQIETGDPVLLATPSGHHDDRGLRQRAQAVEQVDAVTIGQAEIKEYEVGRQGVERLGGRADRSSVELRATKPVDQGARDGLVVFDDQYVHAQVSSSPLRSEPPTTES